MTMKITPFADLAVVDLAEPRNDEAEDGGQYGIAHCFSSYRLPLDEVYVRNRYSFQLLLTEHSIKSKVID
jgi:hypothetical protein